MHGDRHAAAWLLGLIASVSGLACTSVQKAGTSGGGQTAGDACFNIRSADSFSPLDDRFVYVRLLDGKQYLLTLDTIYTGLPFATGIRISNNFGRACSDSGAMVTFRDSDHQAIARVIRVEAVADKAAAQKLVKERTVASPES